MSAIYVSEAPIKGGSKHRVWADDRDALEVACATIGVSPAWIVDGEVPHLTVYPSKRSELIAAGAVISPDPLGKASSARPAPSTPPAPTSPVAASSSARAATKPTPVTTKPVEPQPPAEPDTSRWPMVVAVGSALIVALASAALSIEAQRAVAIEHRAVTSGVALLVPIILDCGALAAAAVIWAQRLAARRPPRLAWVLAGSCLMISTAANVAHSISLGGTWLGAVIAACPPWILLATIELALSLKAVSRPGAPK